MENLKEIIKQFLQTNNLGAFESSINFLIAVITLAGILLTGLYKALDWYRKNQHTRNLTKELPFYTPNEIRKAIRYFVDTNCQSVSPAIANEPGQPSAFVPRQRLIPFFINKAFPSKDGDFKYYILLADSGMGKTTFMINLYLKYRRKIIFLPPFTFDERYKLKLIPLGAPDVLEEIASVKDDDKSSTILLLDALDEDNEAIINYKNRIDALLNATRKFRKVIITCRTQFFKSEEEEPSRVGIMKYGGEKGTHFFAKLYISPFDDLDIETYLQKKIPFYSFAKRSKAAEVVNKCPNLMVRPMLLSYIDDLLGKRRWKYYPMGFLGITLIKVPYITYDADFYYTYQIYEVLINKWIEREAKRSEEEEKFKIELYRFSREISIDIYNNRFERGGLFIDYDAIHKFALVHSIDINHLELTSRSLLNRNNEANFKFSHRSILEYFLALNALKDPDFLKTFNFTGMENVQLFFRELGLHRYVKKFFDLDDFAFYYCTKDGFMGRGIFAFMTLQFMENIVCIRFPEEYLLDENIVSFILAFSSLNIFADTKTDLEKFPAYTYNHTDEYRNGINQFILFEEKLKVKLFPNS